MFYTQTFISLWKLCYITTTIKLTTYFKKRISMSWVRVEYIREIWQWTCLNLFSENASVELGADNFGARIVWKFSFQPIEKE